MTSSHDEGREAADGPAEDDEGQGPRESSGHDRETPEVGLVADEDLPEDLRPTEDNPLAQDADESDDTEDAGPGGADKVDGMPDMGSPA